MKINISGKVIRQKTNAAFQRHQLRDLVGALDRAAPAVDRDDRRQHVDAGRQALVDQRVGDALGDLGVGAGAEADQGGHDDGRRAGRYRVAERGRCAARNTASRTA